MLWQTQCCVVGGGPAGIMAGLLLARAGIGTLVLEKHTDFVRDFRGDTVHPSTMELLAELGWLDAFLQRPHQEFARIRAHIGDSDLTLADFRHLPTRKKCVALMPQWDFLDFLADRAREFPRFSLRMGTTVVSAAERNGKVVGVRAETAGERVDVRADVVIAADGRHSALRAQSGLKVHDVGSPIDVLWLRLPRRPGDPAGGQGWVQSGRFMALLDRGGYWQIAFVIPKGQFETLRLLGIEAFRRDVAETAPFLGDRVGLLGSFDDVRLLVVKIDRLERWYKEGLLFIGDAAHAMSPVGGVGVNLAIQDAVAAANLLARPIGRGRVTASVLAQVQRRRELPARAIQAVQAAVHSHVIRRVFADDAPLRPGRALRLLDRAPLLQRIPAHLIGLGLRAEHAAALA